MTVFARVELTSLFLGVNSFPTAMRTRPDGFFDGLVNGSDPVRVHNFLRHGTAAFSHRKHHTEGVSALRFSVCLKSNPGLTTNFSQSRKKS